MLHNATYRAAAGTFLQCWACHPQVLPSNQNRHNLKPMSPWSKLNAQVQGQYLLTQLQTFVPSDFKVKQEITVTAFSRIRDEKKMASYLTIIQRFSLTPSGIQCLSVAALLAYGYLEHFVDKQGSPIQEKHCVCLRMDCGETLHVDSIHSKVCFCTSEYAVALVTKKQPCWKGG